MLGSYIPYYPTTEDQTGRTFSNTYSPCHTWLGHHFQSQKSAPLTGINFLSHIPDKDSNPKHGAPVRVGRSHRHLDWLMVNFVDRVTVSVSHYAPVLSGVISELRIVTIFWNKCISSEHLLENKTNVTVCRLGLFYLLYTLCCALYHIFENINFFLLPMKLLPLLNLLICTAWSLFSPSYYSLLPFLDHLHLLL